MIAKETAWQIVICYQEIESAKKLLEDTKNMVVTGSEPTHWKDNFGKPTGKLLQLGVPSGDNSHRLFTVSPSAAMLVITDHIARLEQHLKDLDKQARSEADW